MLERDYKFYLAFENSICKDYVTGTTKHVKCFKFAMLRFTVVLQKNFTTPSYSMSYQLFMVAQIIMPWRPRTLTLMFVISHRVSFFHFSLKINADTYVFSQQFTILLNTSNFWPVTIVHTCAILIGVKRLLVFPCYRALIKAGAHCVAC
jgi:hypothetical protein